MRPGATPSRRRRRRRAGPEGLVVVVTAVMLTGCVGLAGTGIKAIANPAVSSTTSSTTTTTVPASPVTPIAWSPCQDGLRCGSVTVPLDYADPDGTTIQIAVAEHPAEDPADDLGPLIFDPGGPGASGISDMANELSAMTPALLDDFDIIAFDPRGVDRSDPVTCGETGGSSVPQGLLPDPVPQTPSAEQSVLAGDQSYAQACEQASGSLLPYVGTVDVVRDLDRIRGALGVSQITYFGQSYGTLIGLMYAQMFPTHVRAMVLDGVIDPALTTEQMVTDQAVGFENVLDQFFAWCASSGCPWQEGSDPTQTLLQLASSLGASPIPAGGGRQAGAGELYTAVLSGLYTTSTFSELGSALADAEAGNGSLLLQMTDDYDTENGPNSVDADNAISCLDHPVPTGFSSYPSMADAAAAQAPFFGAMLIWGMLQCAVWPAPPTRTPGPLRAAGAPPILLVSSSGDPATPHEWAVSVQAELADAVLVTWQGDNHVAFFYSACVRSIDQAYFLSGTLPANGTVCND